MKKIIIQSSLFLFFAACFFEMGCAKGQKNDAGFDAFKNRFVEALWLQYPEWATGQGYYKYAEKLTVPDAKQRAENLAFYKLYADSLHGFEQKNLSPNNQCDYKMMENYLAKSEWQITKFKEFEWNPADYNVADAFNEVLIKPFKPLKERVGLLNKKLENVPAYYAAAKENIKNPTKEHTDLAIAQHAGTEEVFKMLEDSAKAVKNTDPKLAENLAKARAAIKDYLAFLQAKLNDKTIKWRDFRIGKELFAEKFNYDIVSEYSAEQILEKAMAHKKELHTKMIALSNQLWEKHLGKTPKPADSLLMVKMMIDKLAEHHCKPADFVQTIRTQIPALTKFVADKNLLTLDPTQPLQVRETPKFMRGTAGASISSPGPYEKNGTTFYNVDPLSAEDGWTPERSESYLREYNDYMLQILNIHEAIPGHYAQLVYSNRVPSMIKTILGNGAMIEGWAVYTERMMLEQGYGAEANAKEASPEMWLIYYKWNLRSTCNTILDYSLQCNNMQEKDVLDLLQNQAFQTEAEAKGKYKRATLSQVQLCSYFTGFTEIYDFRASLKEKQGDKFDLKAFHEKFLSFGSAPVKFVKMLF